MFLVDNRFQNYGRDVLGWSAKHMGDSICFRADVLRQAGWGAGLTEDYQLRQRLLLEGIRIAYEPNAIGRGEAALTWAQARAQRARWLRGTHDASQEFAGQLLREGIRRRDGALLDGAVQAHLPSFSTLTMIMMLFLFFKSSLICWRAQFLPGARSLPGEYGGGFVCLSPHRFGFGESAVESLCGHDVWAAFCCLAYLVGGDFAFW